MICVELMIHGSILLCFLNTSYFDKGKILEWSSSILCSAQIGSLSRRLQYNRASLIDQLVKNLPTMQETPVRFLGQEDLLEKGSSGECQVNINIIGIS